MSIINTFSKNLSICYLSTITKSVLSFITIPLIIQYFGKVEYGLWAFIMSLVAYLSLVNFGIPYSSGVLIAKLSNSYEKYIILKKSFIFLSLIVLIFLSILIFISVSLPNVIYILGKIPEDILYKAKIFVFWMFFFYLIKIPLTIIFNAFTAFQEIYITKLYELFIPVIQLITLIITMLLSKDIIFFAILSNLIIIITHVIACIHFFIKHKDIKVHKAYNANNVSSKEILKSGFYFFQTGIIGIVIFNTDNFLISHFLGISYIAAYSVASKINIMFRDIFTQICGVLNPMYGKAYSESNWSWMQKTYEHTTIILPIIAGFFWILNIVIMKDFITIWTGDESLYGGHLLIFALGAYGYVLASSVIHYSILVSLNYINKSVKISWAEAILNLVFSIILMQYFDIAGIALGTLSANFLTQFVFLPYIISKTTDNRLKYKLDNVLKHFLLVIIPVILISYVYVYYAAKQNIVVKFVCLLSILLIYLCGSFYFIPEEILIKIKELYLKIKKGKIIK